jgi:hypothetical protein
MFRDHNQFPELRKAVKAYEDQRKQMLQDITDEATKKELAADRLIAELLDLAEFVVLTDEIWETARKRSRLSSIAQSSVIRSPHHVEVDAAIDSLNVCVTVELPDDPPIDVRPKKKSPMPQGPIEPISDRIKALKVASHVKDDFAAPCILNDAKELHEFGIDNLLLGTASAVARQLEVHCRRQRGRIGSSNPQEIPGLNSAWGAEREEVVSAAIETSLVSSGPILGEPAVHEITSLGRLHVGKLDSVGCDSVPVDDVLMSGNVNPVALAFSQLWPPVGDPQKPPCRRETTDHEQCGEGEVAPSARSPAFTTRAPHSFRVRTSGCS